MAVLFWIAPIWIAPIWWVPDVQEGHGGPVVILACNSFFLAAVAFLLLAGLLLWSRRRAGVPDSLGWQISCAPVRIMTPNASRRHSVTFSAKIAP